MPLHPQSVLKVNVFSLVHLFVFLLLCFKFTEFLHHAKPVAVGVAV